MKNKPGTYLILLFNRRINYIKTGRLGRVKYTPGYYLYAGSALNGVKNRVKRHLSVPEKKHWHIDRISPYFEKHGALIIYSEERFECRISNIIKNSYFHESSIERFGSTDCSCISHLHKIKNVTYSDRLEILKKIGTLILKSIVSENKEFEIQLVRK